MWCGRRPGGEDAGKTIVERGGAVFSVFGNSAVLFAEAVLSAVAVASPQWYIYSTVPFVAAVTETAEFTILEAVDATQ